MGVTNGFLRMGRDEFENLRDKQSAFEKRLRSAWAGESDDYYDMDKAGYELLFAMQDASSTLSPPVPPLYPYVLEVLGNGEAIFPQLDMGYGPAYILDPSAMRESLKEFDILDYDAVFAMVRDGGVLEEDLLEDFQEYHWAYLKGLGEFLKDAHARGMTVLRY